jgi:hypothetical protein
MTSLSACGKLVELIITVEEDDLTVGVRRTRAKIGRYFIYGGWWSIAAFARRSDLLADTPGLDIY